MGYSPGGSSQMTYSLSHWHPGYLSRCPVGRTCCERGRCFWGWGWGEVGWGQEEVRVTRRARDQRPPRPGHTGDRETDASSAHHAPEAGPTAPISFSAQPLPHPSAPTRAHTHTDKVIRLPVYCSGARKTTNIRVLGYVSAGLGPPRAD